MNKWIRWGALFLLLTIMSDVMAQGKKVTFNGLARSRLYNNNLAVNGVLDDTVTAKKVNNGQNLLDLAIDIKPNENTEIIGELRILNNFGGFWGADVEIGIRQLYVKGIVGNALRYQLGDINYKLTPYTFYSADEELNVNEADVFSMFRGVIHYEQFYKENTWRQQGAAADFAVQFADYLKELQFKGFISRVNNSNASTIADRLYAVAHVGLVQSKYLSVGGNYSNLFDVQGTFLDSTAYANPVYSLSYEAKWGKEKQFNIIWSGESGMSRSFFHNDTLHPDLGDGFFETGLTFEHLKTGFSITAGYRDVGPDFRSAAAQTRRLFPCTANDLRLGTGRRLGQALFILGNR